jgi:hypothetical protein
MAASGARDSTKGSESERSGGAAHVRSCARPERSKTIGAEPGVALLTLELFGTDIDQACLRRICLLVI